MTTPREYFAYLLEGLKRELELQQELLDIARKKQGLLVTNNIEALVPLLEREEDLVFQTCSMEKRLKNIWKELTERFFPNAGEMHLSKIIELADMDMREEFRRLQESLTAVVEELRELNRRNAILIEDILNYISVVFSLLLREAERQESPYGVFRKGLPEGSIRGVLIDGVV
ncbi:flagellar protein FlgN [Candidatus Caldatribacterium sp.]|uniref:flagellar protein FlgN n=1 Tax=Candidatus Caldatribacterium sp. TaxID=2282143 RepID=UPI0029968AF8|nr:flagellar protein FlgN [Candidatus Caldatribacterium sp.]MDW8081950.1 flagellar protein FlgN [Candidatus Calescibacterium sp.]